MSDTHYPSFAEIEKILAPKIAEIRAQTLFAEYADPGTPAIRYRLVVGEKNAPAETALPADRILMEDHVRFLRDIVDNPSDGLKDRYDQLGWGIPKGNRILHQLKAMGCVRADKVPCLSPKGGRGRLVVSLTQRGRQLLGAYERNQTNQ